MMDRCLAALLGALVLVFTACEPTRGLQEEPLLLEQVHALGLDSLNRGITTVHFSAGHQNRAGSLGSRVERALKLFNDSLDTAIEDFHLIVLAGADWGRLAEMPYGFPVWGKGGWQRRNLGIERPDVPPSTIVPADAKGVVYEQLIALEDCLSGEHRKRVKATELTWDEVARRYVRLITFHEIGHAVTEASEIGEYSWLGEFFANYFGYAYLYHREPERAALWDFLSAVTLECYTPEYRTLEALQLSDMDPAAYHWFESMLIQRANRVVETRGFAFAREARQALPAGGVLSSREDSLWNQVDTLSDEEARQRLKGINDEILRRLERIAPGFQGWGLNPDGSLPDSGDKSFEPQADE